MPEQLRAFPVVADQTYPLCKGKETQQTKLVDCGNAGAKE
jgi:hypothetical protein